MVEERLRSASRWVLLLDFDGTLVPVAANRDDVNLDPAVRRVLRRLVRHPGWRLYIMSGRRLADLRKHIRVPGIRLLGLHGWERRGATLPPNERQVLHRAKGWLAQRLPAPPGIELEDKRYAIAIHYRGVKLPVVRVAERVMLVASKNFRPALHLLKGKQIWELLPRSILGKGPTTQSILRDLPTGTLPIFIGDDTSDESAFAVIQHGLAVHVGGRTKTSANFYVHDPGEVREFLERLEAVTACRQLQPHSNS